MQEKNTEIFTGERAMFGAKSVNFTNCIFEDGESPLKHSSNLKLNECVFAYKYPLWYANDITLNGGYLEPLARAGMWYSANLSFKDALINAPKSFRKSSQISLENINFSDASETLWGCTDVKIKNVFARGDYFGVNSENLEIDGLNLDGNYCFDGCKNVHITNSKLISKDAFWNCENVTAQNCLISGEYLAWNSKNVTLINCTIKSLQALCYVENLVVKDCIFMDTSLAFEYSSVDVSTSGAIKSIKNPKSGAIRAAKIDEIIIDENLVDTKGVKIIITEK